jgi:hypothetical protein
MDLSVCSDTAQIQSLTAEFPAHLEQGIIEAHQGNSSNSGNKLHFDISGVQMRLFRASDSGGVISITQSTAILQREAL